MKLTPERKGEREKFSQQKNDNVCLFFLRNRRRTLKCEICATLKYLLQMASDWRMSIRNVQFFFKANYSAKIIRSGQKNKG